MLSNNTDADWKKFGDCDPYFGVFSDKKFAKENLDDDAKAEFFESGRLYMQKTMDSLAEIISRKTEFSRAMDFGCGVGRLAIPLAAYCDEVIAVDISQSMLKETVKNCADLNVNNVEVALADDDLSKVRGSFDLIHSFIVFQHIPVKRGERIVKELLMRLAPGGIGILHFTYNKNSERHRLVPYLKENIPFMNQFFNWRHGRKIDYPHMQMNDYNLNSLISMIQNRGAERIHLEFTNHRGALGVIVIFALA